MAYQNVDSGTQGLTTKDAIPITLSMNIGYSIADAAQLYSSYQHFDTSLVNKARGFLAEEMPLHTWQEVYSDPAAVAEMVLHRLQEDLGEDSGCVLIEDVTLDQVIQAKAHRLFTAGTIL